jgi:hypothetical protein
MTDRTSMAQKQKGYKMEMDGLTTEHAGVAITYDEDRERWLFTTNGKERSALTLKLAKKAIDEVPKEKRAGFEKFQAYHVSAWQDRQVVWVTSIAEPTGYQPKGETDVWMWIISDEPKRFGKGTEPRRSKQRLSSLYEMTAENEQRWAQIAELEQRVKVLTEQQDEIRRTLTHVRLPQIA